MGANPINRHSMGSSKSAKMNEDIEEVDGDKQFSGISEEEDGDEEFEATEESPPKGLGNFQRVVRDADLAP